MIDNGLTNKAYKAGAYVRLSVEDENKDIESVSITNQRLFIKDYAVKNDIEIYDYYVDDGYSGGNFDRPGFKRLIEDIQKGIINCVITKDMSRLGREFIETGGYVFKYFPENDIRYIAILENYDTLKPNGVEDILPFKAVINDMYLKDISRKIKSVRHNKMKEGLFVGSTVPYGYKRSTDDSRKLVIDDYAAGVVRKIFEMKKAGSTNNMIARQLTNDGVLPPDVYKRKKLNKFTITTNIWKANSIKTILTNEAYIGNLIQGKYERISLKSKKKRLLPRSEWIIKKGALPPIVSKELFEKVNMSKRKIDIRFRQYDYLFKGLVVCADCGKTMLVRKNKNYTIYLCRTYATYRNKVCSMHYYREDILNAVILKEIRDVLIKYSSFEMLVSKYRYLITNICLEENYEKDLKLLKNKVTIIDKAISELYKDRANNVIEFNEFSCIKKELEKDREEYVIKKKSLQTLLEKSKTVLFNENTELKWINEFLKFEILDKKIIKMLIDKIEINQDKSIKIWFNFNLEQVSNE